MAYYEIMEPVIVRIRDFIDRHGLIGKGQRLLLSLSAGKDSMFLLQAIDLLREEIGIQAGIFHLNHMMRGDESDRDEAFLRDLGRIHAMETHITRHDFFSERARGHSFEEEARNVRYRMLNEIAGSCGYSLIATAHTRDDQIETVLMRIFTGTGIYGLQGIPPRRGNIVRPLLPVSSEEIYAYLKTHGIEWREDSTNADVSYSRNYIRHELMPRVRIKFPMAGDALLSLSQIAGETTAMIDAMVTEKYGPLVEYREGILYIDADELKNEYPAFFHVTSSLIRRHFNHYVNRSMLEEIYSKYLIEKANISLFRDRRITADKIYLDGKSRLKIGPAESNNRTMSLWEYRVDLGDAQEQIIELSEIGISVTVKISDHDFFEKLHKNNSYIFVTLENKGESIYIRNRRKGDVIHTETGTKKIKELFIEKKLDPVSKERVPLLVTGNTVAACMTGLLSDIPNRVAADFLVDKNSKKVVAVFRN